MVELFTKKYTKTGYGKVNEICEAVLTAVKSNSKLKESFKEDWSMSSGSNFTTTKLAKVIWQKQYDTFEKYYKCMRVWTPEDLGGMDGAGVYKVPKVANTVAGKLSPGEKVQYVNAAADEMTVETESYGVGLRINRRFLKRAATGAISALLTSASNGVHREIVRTIANGMVSGISSSNVTATGITLDSIADAVKLVTDAVDTNGIRFGFVPDKLVLTTTGKNVLVKTDEWQAIAARWNILGSSDYKQSPIIYDGMEVVILELIDVTYNSKAVHGLVIDSMNYMNMVRETEMDLFEGRIPGTPGDYEYIFAMDIGYAIVATNGAALITAA